VVALPCCAIGVALAAGSVWVTQPTSGAGWVLRINPRSGRMIARIPVAASPSRIVAVGTSAWVATSQPPTSLARIDTATNRATSYLPAGGISDIATGATGLWASEDRSRAVRLDPSSGRVIRRVNFSSSAQLLAVGSDRVWATAPACAGCTRGFVRGVTLSTGITGPLMPTGETPVGIAVGGGALWIANFNSGTITRISTR
jgi:outer membrane protein assembly factor BamB